MENKIIRAAEYTRKSSKEGLEQKFNSLDAKEKPISKASRLQAIRGVNGTSSLPGLETRRLDIGGG